MFELVSGMFLIYGENIKNNWNNYSQEQCLHSTPLSFIVSSSKSFHWRRVFPPHQGEPQLLLLTLCRIQSPQGKGQQQSPLVGPDLLSSCIHRAGLGLGGGECYTDFLFLILSISLSGTNSHFTPRREKISPSPALVVSQGADEMRKKDTSLRSSPSLRSALGIDLEGL